MPVYDYKCNACGNAFETRQSFHDEPVANCPVCGKGAERQITAVAVHFKGSGFYKTDYKSSGRSGNGKSSDAKSETDDAKKEAAPKSEKSSESSSDKSETSTKKSEKKETTKVSE